MESDLPEATADESAVERRAKPSFSINILSGSQACQSLAHRFSQAQANHEAALSDKQHWRNVSATGAKRKGQEAATADKIPIAKNGMASLLCQVVTSIHLSKLLESPKSLANEEARGASDPARKLSQPTRGGQEDGSMLFLARVVEVIPGATTEVLLYKDRKYVPL
ncbi:hypothetical protein QFC19_006669 [Naganishia cerealis]|uniref:Uncharacterized protein n=1 Tax=Naganishia cerealis TaxID=610337 RepID=A0ACC2VG28_9TREE|nr:hypothetical protein QFC19_006669 [Naganishia cerealis]